MLITHSRVALPLNVATSPRTVYGLSAEFISFPKISHLKMHGFQESPRAIIIFRVILFLLLIKESWHKIEKYLTDDERTIACRGTFRLQIVQTGNRSGVLGIEMKGRLGLKAGSEVVGTEKFPSVLVKWSKMTQGTCSYEPKWHVTMAAVSKRTQQSESEVSCFLPNLSKTSHLCPSSYGSSSLSQTQI